LLVELLQGLLELLELPELLLLLWVQEEEGEVWLQLLLSASCFPPKQANNIGR
jgi:hypothetical protein